MHSISRRTRPIGSRGVVDVLTVIRIKAVSKIRVAVNRVRAKAGRAEAKTATTTAIAIEGSAETPSLSVLWTTATAIRATEQVPARWDVFATV